MNNYEDTEDVQKYQYSGKSQTRDMLFRGHYHDHREKEERTALSCFEKTLWPKINC